LALFGIFCTAFTADFTGTLSVGADTAITLQVWVNGEKKGETPLVLNDVPVGNYNISFIDPQVRDSILANETYRVPLDHPVLASLPPGMVSLIQKNLKKGVPLLARYSNYAIIVQNGKNEQVTFEAAGFSHALESEISSGKVKYALLAAGAIGIVVFIFVQVAAF